ncbi:response regulator [Herbaspirillum seropedicae]|jgi:CheY-like chemotaxis protein|uniref:Two-component system sensor histidine kinase/response regulator, putative n=1 Tax=Ricinus communis TaxID=3988 RepID=B9TBZ4_RICCO|nr:response regulator [Herbaspirillum seropedicae]EEF26620.1 two-component system sensor histidine kinase/response regulator, putative [Ricinus communis]AKN67082.1 histidine kinase [Herbaspirillum seropedicae]AON56129.1 two-component system sensor histidine kinase/response regulator, putative [Herbaspirillum seropedicae]MDR6395509.1 CheY-like chemotaxis protein [Herbaspirillum seropedicae]NQE30317.1 histidine kinase [Herbaspirillum seropedicae]
MSTASALPQAALPLLLIVDDEVDITDTYSMLLELHGYRVITACHGADALDKARQHWPDLVISDCMMPVMNGLELCAALRRLPGGAQLPVILCSGAPERHDLSQSSHNLFLRKPVFFDRLLEEIGRLLPGRP